MNIMPVADIQEVISKEEVKRIIAGKLQGLKIAVITIGLGGFGDYLCAAKICTYFHESLGLDMKNIALATEESPNVRQLLSSKGIQIIDHHYDSLKKWGVDFQVIAPVADSWLASQHVETSIPTLAIAEYGFNSPDYLKKESVATYAFGLSDNSMGIIFEPQQRESDPLVRLTNLCNIPLNIQKAILGEEFSQRAIEKFAASSKLYFSYAHNESEMLSFMQAIVKMSFQLNDDKECCFYFMGNDLSDPKFWFVKDDLKEETIFNTFKKCGIGIIEYKWLGSENETLLFHLNKDSERKIKIITGNIPHQYVMTLHQSSEKEALVTGDQSFSEAIAVKKFPIYEYYRHKKEFFEQFQSLIPEEIRDITSFYKGKDIQLVQALDANKLANFLVLNNTDERTQQLVDEVLNNISNNYNFAERFDSAINMLLEKTKEVKKNIPKKIDLPSKELLLGDEIPFDEFFQLSTDDIVKLLINSEGKSKLPIFDDSVFTCNSIGRDGYLCKREKVLMAVPA